VDDDPGRDIPRPDDGDLAAGDFSAWMTDILGALRGERDAEVPCHTCTACCTSSQFVHIGPDETDTLRHIPGALLFPAPRLPRGHLVLGYDERGHCPMLVHGACSIYEHRPQTCRTYDCRIFPATGVDADKPLITRQTQRWNFSFASLADRVRHQAVRAAAAFLGEHRSSLPDGAVPANATQLAVLAIELHEMFLAHDAGNGRSAIVEPPLDTVHVELARRTGARGRT
jgi:hypothetical protein